MKQRAPGKTRRSSFSVDYKLDFHAVNLNAGAHGAA